MACNLTTKSLFSKLFLDEIHQIEFIDAKLIDWKISFSQANNTYE